MVFFFFATILVVDKGIAKRNMKKRKRVQSLSNVPKIMLNVVKSCTPLTLKKYYVSLKIGI
jgi:hypothetical protein